jgi:hypothetical protein
MCIVNGEEKGERRARVRERERERERERTSQAFVFLRVGGSSTASSDSSSVLSADKLLDSCDGVASEAVVAGSLSESLSSSAAFWFGFG